MKKALFVLLSFLSYAAMVVKIIKQELPKAL